MDVGDSTTLATPTDEAKPCYTDAADPFCAKDQYLDRSGLIAQPATSIDIRETACVCRLLPLDCQDNYVYDKFSEECVCLEQACADNHFWDVNSCSCMCDDFQACQQDFHWDNTQCRCRCDPKPEECSSASQTILGAQAFLSIWSSDSCQCECVEPSFDYCN